MSKRLVEQDYIDAAKTLNCEVAAVKTVVSVEAGKGGGFWSNGKPKILFESRWFHKLTKGKYDESHPHISTPTWVRNYIGGPGEYDRLGEAIELDAAAAVKSCSWGMFQILGVNHGIVGYSDVFEFVDDMYESERKHLDAFVEFVFYNNLDDELRDHRWADFARVYNGPGYRKNNYDVKMANAYAFYSGKPKPVPDRTLRLTSPYMRGDDVRKVQQRLGITADGVFGPGTEAAVIEFQDANDLIPDGIVGANTKARMGLNKYGLDI